MKYLLLLLAFVAVSSSAQDPPYLNVAGGRAPYALASETVNEARLYDFYARQADYYLGNPDKIPAILPAHPGLDGGKHGHWGKHNQNRHEDGRWNEIEFGEMVTQVFRAKDLNVLKGICLRLGDSRELSACFDPQTLQYRALWSGGFVKFHPFRWGTSRNAEMDGKAIFIAKSADMPAGGEYLGFRRHGTRVTFDFRIGDTQLEDSPWAVGDVFLRQIHFADSAGALTLPARGTVVSQSGVKSASTADGQLAVTGAEKGATVVLAYGGEADFPAFANSASRWSERIQVKGTLGAPLADSAYVVDTIPVPFDNPYKSVMQLSGIDFLPNGNALISVLSGDIWQVSGLDSTLANVTWRRFATGFNQPMGIHIDDDGIFVLDRGQIYRLHDDNSDGEADRYENWANDFGGYNRSHTHTFGLHRTGDGAFHFTQRESIMRTGLDRKTELQGAGVRNCMGIGGGSDFFWVGPQEGTWTPATSIIEVNRNEFYGLTKAAKIPSIAAPLCFIPRGVDNSVGGFVEVTSDKWGPFQGRHVGLSYGSGLHYLVLRDASGARPQGAVVPMAGEFLSGSVRGAFQPQDGQLYVVGLDGWGDYSAKDGCLHRVRYTGAPVYKPSGFRVHTNGLRVDFSCELSEDVGTFFAQMWNYEYAKRYGSPEFSVRTPKSLGHDHLTVRSITRLAGGKSIFVELPGLEPAMQVQLRMHLKAADGKAFKTDLFGSPMYPSPAFQAVGIAADSAEKPTAIALRVMRPKGKQPVETGELVEGAREIALEAAGGLQYKQKLLQAKAGEALTLRFRNTDVMPHNMVIVAPDAIRTVGEASFKMLNDPMAGVKHYVPDLPEVIVYCPVIDPGKEHRLHFRAPTKPGRYPYICTFPGHWQAMQGVLEVSK
jgi:azurin